MLSRQFLCLGRSCCSSGWGTSWSRRSHHQGERQKRLSAGQIDRLAERLRSAVGPDNVSLAEVVRSQHSQDEGPEKGALPDLVVYATSTEHVSEVLSYSLSLLYYFLRSISLKTPPKPLRYLYNNCEENNRLKKIFRGQAEYL